MRQALRDNRDFLVRVVSVLAEAGIDQFIDLGSGFPTSPNVHEVARAHLLDPGLVPVAHWRADGPGTRGKNLGAVARTL